jgi:hypothetical protein
MNALAARWIGLLVLVAGVTAATPEARGLDGRWKLGGDGGCFFDATDSGPDQCAPTTGRWKLGGDGSCYFDATDGGPDQCAPATGALTETEAEDIVVLPGDHEVGVRPVGPGRQAPDRGPRPAPASAP